MASFFNKQTLRERKVTQDGLYKVWLWWPTQIYELQVPELHRGEYLTPSYKAWLCWAMRREGAYIGIVHEHIERWSEIRDRDELFKNTR